MEGLVMYLQPDSVDETFKVIEKFAGKGSILVFDYVRVSIRASSPHIRDSKTTIAMS